MTEEWAPDSPDGSARLRGRYQATGARLALVPELPGGMSDGETRAEALVNVEDAISVWLHCAQKQGLAIPEPRRAVA
jgi:antitoxin HicB